SLRCWEAQNPPGPKLRWLGFSGRRAAVLGNEGIEGDDSILGSPRSFVKAQNPFGKGGVVVAIEGDAQGVVAPKRVLPEPRRDSGYGQIVNPSPGEVIGIDMTTIDRHGVDIDHLIAIGALRREHAPALEHLRVGNERAQPFWLRQLEGFWHGGI